MQIELEVARRTVVPHDFLFSKVTRSFNKGRALYFAGSELGIYNSMESRPVCVHYGDSIGKCRGKLFTSWLAYVKWLGVMYMHSTLSTAVRVQVIGFGMPFWVSLNELCRLSYRYLQDFHKGLAKSDPILCNKVSTHHLVLGIEFLLHLEIFADELLHARDLDGNSSWRLCRLSACREADFSMTVPYPAHHKDIAHAL